MRIFTFANVTKTVVLISLAVYFFWLGAHPNVWSFLDNVNLIFHEAGHLIFRPFGEFVTILGGSLMQIIVPMVFIIYFMVKRQIFSGCLIGLWMGQSFFNIALYAADALKMQLPLLGGDSSIHDWNYLLTKLNLISHVGVVAGFIKFLGIFSLIFSLAVWFLYFLRSDRVKNYV